MELQLRNIGMIKEADIILDRLTLIAGENDTGKSTVGKALYSVVAGLNNSEKHYDNFITKQLDTNIFNLKKLVENYFIDEIKNKKNDIIQDMIYNSINKKVGIDEKDIKILIENNKNKLISNLLCIDDYFYNNLSYSINIIKNIIDNIKKYNIHSKEIDKETKAIINKLNNANIDRNQKKIISIFAQLNIEFGTNLIRINSDNAIIKLIDKNETIMDINIDKKYEIKYNNDIKEILIDNITYPIDINIFDNLLIPYNRDSDIGKDIESHIIDFQNKINKYKELKNNYNSKLNDYIKSIINGNIEYTDNYIDFSYVKNNNYFELINVSSGIKSFSIIDLLLKAGIFNDKHILILDEPEVHLHPKWQIEYAKLMVKIAEEFDIKILINSHSPYFIEAIQKYSEKSEKIADKTNFYLSEKQDDGYAVIKNVNNDIESIYKTLADAYRKLDKDTLWNESEK